MRDVAAAVARIAPFIRRTRVLDVAGDDLGVSAIESLHVKLEYQQFTGTFKARGATNFILTNEISEVGVTAASGGNHGAAVAWAAREHGHEATIFVEFSYAVQTPCSEISFKRPRR